MTLAPLVEELLEHIERSGLASYAQECRDLLEDGEALEERTIVPAGGTSQCLDPTRRRFTPEEQVELALDFIDEQLIQPYRLLQQAEAVASTFVERSSASSGLSIMLSNSPFEDALPTPAYTAAEAEAAAMLAELLPLMRDAMGDGIEDGEGADGE